MTTPSIAPPASAYRRVSSVAGYIAVISGIIVLAGWAIDAPALKTFVIGFESMKANTALCFILSGVALILATRSLSESRYRAPVLALGGLVSLIGLLTVLEYFLGWDFGIDELLFRDAAATPSAPPGRMALNTAFGFVSIGLSLMLVDARTRRLQWSGQGLAIFGGIVSVLALVGYAYSQDPLIGLNPYVRMALHTALGLLLLACGLLAARPQQGIMARVTADTVGAILLRRLLPLVVGIPLLLGWIAILAHRWVGYGVDDITLLAVGSAAVFFALVWNTSSHIDLMDEDRRRAESALWETEARFKAAAEGSLDALFILEAVRDSNGKPVDFKFVEVNGRAEKLVSLPREAIIGRNLCDLFPHNRTDGFFDRYVKLLEDGEPLDEEFPVAVPGIAASWLRHQVTRLGDGIVITSRDVTERVRAQLDLQKERNFVGAVLETAAALVVVLDRQGRIVRFNRACQAVTGYSFDEVKDRPFWEVFLVPEELEEVQGVFLQLRAGNFPMRHENFWLAKDGSRRLIAWANAALVDNTGEVEFVISTGVDITERRKAQEERERLAKDLQLLLESTDEGLYGVDMQGLCTFINASASRMIGYPPEEAYGKNMHDLIHHTCSDGRPYFVDDCPIYEAFHAGRGVRRDDEVFWRKDGTSFPVEYSSYPIVEDGVMKGAVVAFSDIAQRKEAQEAIQKLNEDLARRATELIASNKELEAFSYSVSHDLRAPLRTIDGFSLALMEDYADTLDETGKDYLSRVRAASQRMGALIDDMLQLSRLTRSEMKLEMINLSDIASGIAAEVRKSDPERQVEFVIEPGLVARADSRLITVLMENLLGNAWKFTSRQSLARIEFGSIRSDDTATYFVRDNGAGFDMSYAGKLFGAFQRLHAMTEFPGNGIGLATVQRIVHRHGGRVRAEGEVDKGATFYFTLP